MATLKAILTFDGGPERCPLEDIDVTNSLPFAAECTELGTELCALIQNYKQAADASQEAEKRYVARSVASWIFHTNQLEFSGLATEGDTEERVRLGYSHYGGSDGDRDVLVTFELLKETYDEDQLRLSPPHLSASFDPPRLLVWHARLFAGTGVAAGVFRTSGAHSRMLRGPKYHFYPHHSIVKPAIASLGHIVYQMLQRLGTLQDPVRRLTTTFAIGAFAHYHFLAIHPFGDGNGRVGRFLLKRILDLVVPVPFGLFRDRTAYISLLESAEQGASSNEVIRGLMESMIRNAIWHYKDILGEALQPYQAYVVATDTLELRRRLRELDVYGPALDSVVEKFEALAEGAVEDIETTSGWVRIKKFPSFIIDDI